MRTTLKAVCSAMLVLLLSAAAHAEVLTSSADPPGTIHESLARELHAAVTRGLDWLAARQSENGSWSNPRFPALTALPMQAFLQSGREEYRENVERAVAYIKSCVQEDGGIYTVIEGRRGGGLGNYNTAICMTALHATRDRSLAGIVLDARSFLAGAQHFGDDVYRGGFGYDAVTDRPYTDLLNTYYAVVAMRETQDIEDLRPSGRPRADIDWSATVRYISSLQNRPDTGDDAGGFVYNPVDPKAGTATNGQGVVHFRSYGSITYAGLLALIYAEVSRDDVRVRSAFDWASRHWSLEENPGMGTEGLYFFYNVLTKALAVYGSELIPVKDGQPVNWRSALAEKLVSTQTVDPETGHGYWVNEVGRYWENDPVLVTAYALIALQML